MRRIPFPLLPRWLRWVGVALVAGAVFAMSVLTVPPSDPVVGRPSAVPLDKWRHFLAYAAVGGSLAYATAEWNWPTWRLLALVVGLTVVYGVGIEAIQAFLPERYFGLGDAYANALGGLLVLPWFAVRNRLAFVRIPGRFSDRR